MRIAVITTENSKPKKLWRTRSVRHSFLGFGIYYGYLLSVAPQR